jgi:hypothetical protein
MRVYYVKLASLASLLFDLAVISAVHLKLPLFVRRCKTLSTEAYSMFVLLGREDFTIPIASAARPTDTKMRSSGFELGLLDRRR